MYSDDDKVVLENKTAQLIDKYNRMWIGTFFFFFFNSNDTHKDGDKSKNVPSQLNCFCSSVRFLLITRSAVACLH